MEPKLSDIMFHAMKFSDNIMLQMPKNTNIENLLKIFHKCSIRPMITIEKILTNGKVSQLFIYIGSENFMRINSSLLYNQLYKDLDK
jgi:Tfp pilus assembly protein PilO